MESEDSYMEELEESKLGETQVIHIDESKSSNNHSQLYLVQQKPNLSSVNLRSPAEVKAAKVLQPAASQGNFAPPRLQALNKNSKSNLSSIYANDRTMFKLPNEELSSALWPGEQQTDFGNEFVLQLEQENSRLRAREEELKAVIAERLRAQQRRREELVAMLQPRVITA